MTYMPAQLPKLMAADISGCVELREYRLVWWYHLKAPSKFSWGKTLCFVMANPSTADAYVKDPTVIRCISFAKRFGYSTVIVVNLYALRSPYPEKLREHHAPIGPTYSRGVNDQWIRYVVKRSGLVIAAWGSVIDPHNRAPQVTDMMCRLRSDLYCLGRTKDNRPRHPLMLASNTELEPFCYRNWRK